MCVSAVISYAKHQLLVVVATDVHCLICKDILSLRIIGKYPIRADYEERRLRQGAFELQLVA